MHWMPWGFTPLIMQRHAKGRQQGTLTKYQSWALSETQTSTIALCAQPMTNADSSMNGIENKELNDPLSSRRVVMAVIKNEKLLLKYTVSSQASTCLCPCWDSKNLLKQTAKSGSHTTLRRGILRGSIITEQWCMPKWMIKNQWNFFFFTRNPSISFSQCYFCARKIQKRLLGAAQPHILIFSHNMICMEAHSIPAATPQHPVLQIFYSNCME